MILQAVGQKLADAIKRGDSVVVELDFKESMAHPDDRYRILHKHCIIRWANSQGTQDHWTRQTHMSCYYTGLNGSSGQAATMLAALDVTGRVFSSQNLQKLQSALTR